MGGVAHAPYYSILQCSNAKQHERNQQSARHWRKCRHRAAPPGRHSDNVVAILAQSCLAGRLRNSMSERLAVEIAHLSTAHLLGCVAVPRSEPSDQAARLEEASCRARLVRIRPLWSRLLHSARASRSRISARARHGSKRSLCQSSAMIGSSKRSSSPGSWPAAYGEKVSSVSCDQSRSSRAAEAVRC